MHKPNIKKTIKNLSKPGENLTQRAVRGGFWVFSLRAVGQSLNLVRLIILARILAPNDFGLLGVALLTMATLETFTQTGFQQALIQKKKDIKSYLDSAWTVSILRGIILFTILYLIAPYAASFFEVPEAKLIIQVIGFSILLKAFTNIGVIYFQKELEFNKQFIYQLSGTLVDFIVAVSAALMLQNVWALIYGVLAGNLVRCIASYIVHPYRPHLSLDLEKAKELFGFGKWIMGSSILVFLISQGDDIFVGKLIGVTALAFYQMAFKISLLPVREITLVISQISFPVFSKLQDKTTSLRTGYLKLLRINNFITLPFAMMIFFFSYEFTYLILGEKWLLIVPLLKIFSIMVILSSINASTGSLYNAVGMPSISAKSQMIKMLTMFSIIYPLIVKFGLIGAALASLVGEIIVTPYLYYKILSIIDCKFKEIIKTILPSITCTMITMLTLFVLKNKVFSLVNLPNMVVLAVTGVVVYIIMTLFFERTLGHTVIRDLKEIKTKMVRLK